MFKTSFKLLLQKNKTYMDVLPRLFVLESGKSVSSVSLCMTAVAKNLVFYFIQKIDRSSE